MSSPQWEGGSGSLVAELLQDCVKGGALLHVAGAWARHGLPHLCGLFLLLNPLERWAPGQLEVEELLLPPSVKQPTCPVGRQANLQFASLILLVRNSESPVYSGSN